MRKVHANGNRDTGGFVSVLKMKLCFHKMFEFIKKNSMKLYRILFV